MITAPPNVAASIGATSFPTLAISVLNLAHGLILMGPAVIFSLLGRGLGLFLEVLFRIKERLINVVPPGLDCYCRRNQFLSPRSVLLIPLETWLGRLSHHFRPNLPSGQYSLSCPVLSTA